jgi:cytochrome c-type biogenesis protein
MTPEKTSHNIILLAALGLTVITAVALIWFFFFLPTGDLGQLGWYLFSFAAGLTMIVMPCTLPLAFVIVPMVMGKGIGKGLRMALSFGTGVALMLSLYGVIAAAFGKAGIQYLGADGEGIKNWIYFLAGIFAYTFALGEIGLVKFRMPSYTGSAPSFIQMQKDETKAFLLGLFLGNVGVGCPHPATPLILIEIASSGNIFYGWTLFLIHAIGRVIPLLILSLLAVGEINGLSWLMARKDKIERATGWAMVFVAGFILTLGLFSHDWWVNSGQHNLLEKLTNEHGVNEALNTNLGTNVAHVHGLETGVGLFGQPLEWGNWFIVILWIVPLWWYWLKERKRVKSTPALRMQAIEHKMDKLREELRSYEISTHIPESAHGARIKEIETLIDGLEQERRAHEEVEQYGTGSGLRNPEAQEYEEKLLSQRRGKYFFASLFIVVTFAWALPMWFRYVASGGSHDHGGTTAAAALPKVSEVIAILDGRTPGTKSQDPQSEVAPAPAAGDGHNHTH